MNGEALPEAVRIEEMRVRLLAASPDVALRDPARAVLRGERLIRREATAGTVAALAMAHAAAGNWEQAVSWQERALAATADTQAGLRSVLGENLGRYREGRPANGPIDPRLFHVRGAGEG